MNNLIKVMIVDDEILAIEDLENLISWELHGFQIVATATNSQKALEMYKRLLPQIIFVDIRMPVLNGLEFSQKILSFGNPVKIILLTAYKDFEYAKQAVEIGVSNYLLKHDINENSLIQELQKVKKELESEERTGAIVKSQYIRQMLNGEINEDNSYKFKELSTLMKDETCFSLLIAKADKPVIEEFIQENPVKNINLNGIQCLELIDSVNWIEALDLNQFYVFLVSLKKSYSRSDIHQKLYQTALQIQNYFEGKSNESFSIVLTFPEDNIYGIPELFKKGCNALKFSKFMGRGKIYSSENLNENPLEISPEIEMCLKEISRKIGEEDVDNLTMVFKKMYRHCLHPLWNPDGCNRVCRETYYILNHYRKNNNLDDLQELFRRGRLDITGLYQVSEIEEWFLKIFQSTFHDVKTAASIHYSKKVQQIIDYIEARFAEELSVEKVAEDLGISGVYLSQIFKKETHRTFLEYLTEYRIHVAKKMLINSDAKVYEIAEKVGYKTSQYFSQVFHKVTGRYPFDWRESGGDR